MKKFLIDTSIWVDLYENRFGYLGEPLGEYALKLFYKILSEKNNLVVSDLLLKELGINYSLSEINGMLKPFCGLCEHVISSPEQKRDAEKISLERKIPPGDALHAIIARDLRAILVTRDRHFKKLLDICPSYTPENIIKAL